jgi:hypothetical protein
MSLLELSTPRLPRSPGAASAKTKWLTRIVSGLLGALVVVALALSVSEVVHFATSTENSAREEARLAFLEECRRRSLNAEEYQGPLRVKSPEQTYGFVWKKSSSGDRLLVLTRYFPSGTEAWFIGREEKAQLEPYYAIK